MSRWVDVDVWYYLGRATERELFVSVNVTRWEVGERDDEQPFLRGGVGYSGGGVEERCYECVLGLYI